MARKLQPIVVDSQQLIVLSATDILQPMVVKTRMEEKLSFATRLDAACAACESCPKGRHRVNWLRMQFDPPLSNQGVRKWFTGEVIPDQTNIARLAAVLDVNAQWLQAGPGDEVVKALPPDEGLQKVIRAWPEMGDDLRKRLEHYAELSLPLPDKNH
jgi:hypothetical protein